MEGNELRDGKTNTKEKDSAALTSECSVNEPE